jgi:hypothetical protein
MPASAGMSNATTRYATVIEYAKSDELVIGMPKKVRFSGVELKNQAGKMATTITSE